MSLPLPLPAVANLCQCCVACPIFHISSFSPVAPPTSLAGSSSSFSQLPTQQVLRAANLCGDPIYVSPDVYARRCGQMRRCARPCTARRHCPSATVPIVRVAGSGAAGCCSADAASMSVCKQQARISHISIQTVRTVVFLVIERSTARRIAACAGQNESRSGLLVFAACGLGCAGSASAISRLCQLRHSHPRL